jgi:signal transduction histidine kinase
VGLGPGRDDSHGIRIMRERARRIGGTLELTDTGQGALLRVYIAPAGNGRNSETLLEGSMQP